MHLRQSTNQTISRWYTSGQVHGKSNTELLEMLSGKKKIQENLDDNNEISEINFDNNKYHKNFLKAIHKSNNSQSDKRLIHTNNDIINVLKCGTTEIEI